MRTLHIIMPMAGEGARFANAGWDIPKPLIELNGKTLFQRAIDSVRNDRLSMKYSFIVRQEHIERYAIDVKIKSVIPNANLYADQKTTRGAVETCLMAENVIEDDDAVIVMDCDLEFRSVDYENLVIESLSQTDQLSIDGVLLSFHSRDSRYSYACVAENNRVTRTAEKEPISNHALCGAYFFAEGKVFKRSAHQLLLEGVQGKKEFYISLLYNYLIKEGKQIYLANVQEYKSYGTPEELNQYLCNK